MFSVPFDMVRLKDLQRLSKALQKQGAGSKKNMGREFIYALKIKGEEENGGFWQLAFPFLTFLDRLHILQPPRLDHSEAQFLAENLQGPKRRPQTGGGGRVAEALGGW